MSPRAAKGYLRLTWEADAQTSIGAERQVRDSSRRSESLADDLLAGCSAHRTGTHHARRQYSDALTEY